MLNGRRIVLVSWLPFALVHVVAIASAVAVGFSWKLLGLALALYYGRMAFTTIGYHRYFSHRTFKTSRWFQFLLAFFAETSAQKGVLWGAAHHHVHHPYSYLAGTPPSPN